MATYPFKPQDKIILLGDEKGESSLHLNFARNQCQRIYNIWKITGNDQFKTFTFINPSKTKTNIKIWVKSGQKLIQLETSQGCPEVYNGLIHSSFIVSSPDPNDSTKQIQKLHEFYPSVAQSRLEKKSQAWRDEPFLAQQIDDSFGIDNSENPHVPSQHTFIKSGMYTGLMRGMMQLLLGQNKKILFKPYFNKTHGIIKTFDSKNRPVLFMVEISPNGVYSSPFNICSKNPSTIPDLINFSNFNPVDTQFPEINEKNLNSGLVTKLLDASAMADFYSNAPFYSYCGWAFNYSGTEAQNTCWGLDSSTYKLAKRYKINFIFTNGKPSGASIVQMESSIMWTFAPASAYHVPNEDGTIHTFNMVQGLGAGEYTGPQNAALHVYYTTGDQEQVIRKYYEAKNDYIADNFPEYDDSEIWGPNFNQKTPSKLSKFGDYVRLQAASTTSPKNGFLTPHHSPQDIVAFGEKTSISIKYQFDGIMQLIRDRRYAPIYGCSAETSVESNSSTYFEAAIVIPLWDRECYFYYDHYTSNILSSYSKSYSHLITAFTYGDWMTYNYASDADAANAANGTGNYTIIPTGETISSPWNENNLNFIGGFYSCADNEWDAITSTSFYDETGSFYQYGINIYKGAPKRKAFARFDCGVNPYTGGPNVMFANENIEATPEEVTYTTVLHTSSGDIQLPEYVAYAQNLTTAVYPTISNSLFCEFIKDVFSSKYFFELKLNNKYNFTDISSNYPTTYSNNLSWVGRP